MNKRELEEHVLGLARPLLHKLYGGFCVDKEQTDKPDAAIYVKKPHKKFGRNRHPFKIGVEITTVDKEKYLAYLKDEKFGKDKINKQVEDLLQHGIDGNEPHKKIDLPINEAFIYDGIIKKKDKYLDYLNSDLFREMILICFSEAICLEGPLSQDGIMDWTDFYLSKKRFPFDKVLFVSLRENKSVILYDKNSPRLKQPKPFKYDHFVSKIQYPVMKIGKQYNLNDISCVEPLIPLRIKRK